MAAGQLETTHDQRVLGSFLRDLNPEAVDIDIARTVLPRSGFVTEHQDRKVEDGRGMTLQKLLLCEVRDGRIAEVVVYCSGEWDAELRARHGEEALILRP
jgi:hypothetical protein